MFATFVCTALDWNRPNALGVNFRYLFWRFACDLGFASARRRRKTDGRRRTGQTDRGRPRKEGRRTDGGQDRGRRRWNGRRTTTGDGRRSWGLLNFNRWFGSHFLHKPRTKILLELQGPHSDELFMIIVIFFDILIYSSKYFWTREPLARIY